jgi:hypothetical protein
MRHRRTAKPSLKKAGKADPPLTFDEQRFLSNLRLIEGAIFPGGIDVLLDALIADIISDVRFTLAERIGERMLEHPDWSAQR